MIRTIKPVSELQQYNPNTNVSWNLSIENEELVKNSITISGDLYLGVDNTKILEIDKLVGIHSFFNYWIPGCEKFGNFEACDNYPRMIKHLNISNSPPDNNGINKDGECRFLLDNAKLWYQAQGDHISFVFKPLIPFNRSNINLYYSKFGNLSLQVLLVDKSKALKSDDPAATLLYSMKNLKMT